jgi:hypothetical protein
MMTFSHGKRETTRDDSNSSAPPAYTSYAGHVYFQYPDAVPLFQLRMDTWYYSELEDLGRIRLGAGPITRDSGVAQALGIYITGFKDAFAGLFRLDSRDSYFGVRIDSEQFAEQFAAQLPERQVIDGVIAHFDVWAAVRDSQGAIQHQWITGVGNLWLSARGKTQQGGEHPDTLLSWSAHVMLGVGSLFRPDNQQALRHARTLWKDLRQRYPDSMSFADAQESEGLEEPSIITLAEVPPGTSSDNRDLCALNLPRLQVAVARWEQITGYPFAWAEPFKQLG